MFVKSFLSSAGLLNGLLVQFGQTAPTENVLHARQVDIDGFIESQEAISFQGVLNNLGPDGPKAPGAYPGIVIASPSQVDPPCMSASSRASLHTLVPPLTGERSLRLLHLVARCCPCLQGAGGAVSRGRVIAGARHSGLHLLSGLSPRRRKPFGRVRERRHGRSKVLSQHDSIHW